MFAYNNKLSKMVRSRKPHGSRHTIFYILYFIFSLFGFTSCELLDFDVDSDLAQIAAQMKLNFDTAYVYKGYTLNVIPVFEPDSLNITDLFYTSGDSTVVEVNMLTGKIVAVGAGWAELYAESVSARIKDSCTVCVMEPWDVTQDEYPYETVFYADVTVKGEPLNENMVVAAFVGNECRCIGEALEFHGINLIQFRVGGEDAYGNKLIVIPSDDNSGNEEEEDDEDEDNDDEEDNEEVEIPDNDEGEENDDIWDIFDDDDEGGDEGGEDVGPTPPQEPQTIVFRCYDKKKLKLYECAVTVPFDGATRGTLSNLYKIDFK